MSKNKPGQNLSRVEAGELEREVYARYLQRQPIGQMARELGHDRSTIRRHLKKSFKDLEADHKQLNDHLLTDFVEQQRRVERRADQWIHIIERRLQAVSVNGDDTVKVKDTEVRVVVARDVTTGEPVLIPNSTFLNAILRVVKAPDDLPPGAAEYAAKQLRS